MGDPSWIMKLIGQYGVDAVNAATAIAESAEERRKHSDEAKLRALDLARYPVAPEDLRLPDETHADFVSRLLAEGIRKTQKAPDA